MDYVPPLDIHIYIYIYIYWIISGFIKLEMSAQLSGVVLHYQIQLKCVPLKD